MKRKNNKDDILDKYRKIRRELIFEQVNEAIKSNPDNWRASLEDLGFEWHDDEDYDQILKEESEAVPENLKQEYLVAYYEGHAGLNKQTIDAFIDERDSDNPNYPLFRRYFRQGNKYLKELLLLCLSEHPTDRDFLSDLVFFHEYTNILRELIQAYIKACIEESNIEMFKELTRDFYYNTKPDGYDALYELTEIFKNNREKISIIYDIKKEVKQSPEIVKFK